MTPKKSEHPFFRFYALDWWDKSTIAVYTILTIIICYLLYNRPPYDFKGLISGYGFATHLFLYFFNYKSLRNFYVYLFWCAIGILHLYLYFQFKDDKLLDFYRTSAFLPFRNTLILLVLFQLLRWLSRKVSGLELVAPSKSRTDIWDGRKATPIDLVCFVVFFAATVILNTVE